MPHSAAAYIIFCILAVAISAVSSSHVPLNHHGRVRRMINGTRVSLAGSPTVKIETNFTYQKRVHGASKWSGPYTEGSNCTGSLITSHHVLSAAQCFDEVYHRDNGKIYLGEDGEYNYTDYGISVYIGLTDMTDLRNVKRRALNGMDLLNGTDKIVITPKSLGFVNMTKRRERGEGLMDIAIVTLSRPVNLTATNNRLASLFAPDEFPKYYVPPSVLTWAMGWGQTEMKSLRNPEPEYGYRIAPFKTLNHTECDRANAASRGPFYKRRPKDTFCGIGQLDQPPRNQSGYIFPKYRPRICHGDSGGPLFLNGTFVQLGIVDFWGDRKGTCNGTFNGFLRVDSYIDFIRKAVNGSSELTIETNLTLIGPRDELTLKQLDDTDTIEILCFILGGLAVICFFVYGYNNQKKKHTPLINEANECGTSSF